MEVVCTYRSDETGLRDWAPHCWVTGDRCLALKLALSFVHRVGYMSHACDAYRGPPPRRAVGTGTDMRFRFTVYRLKSRVTFRLSPRPPARPPRAPLRSPARSSVFGFNQLIKRETTDRTRAAEATPRHLPRHCARDPFERNLASREWLQVIVGCRSVENEKGG